MEWDINDATIPNTVNHYEPYQDWPDDHIRLVYPLNSEPARRHSSGWAMRNTNNHNVHILKKSCLGVLMCSRRCHLGGGVAQLRLRPAICDKARKKQLGRPCPNPKCGGGSLVLIPCKGNSGFPCTHFWRHTGNAVFFQAKGIHDHPRPEVKNNNVEVRKTIGIAKLGSKSGRREGGVTNHNSSEPHPPPLPLNNPTPRRGKTGRKPKSIKNEPPPLEIPPFPGHPGGCGTSNSRTISTSSTYPYPPHKRSRIAPVSHPKPHPPHSTYPSHPPQSYPPSEQGPNPSGLHFPDSSTNSTKPSFPDWHFLPQEELSQKSVYPNSSSSCSGCGQPHFYCNCNSTPYNPDFGQVQHLEPVPSGFIPFNNNLDTFKPSDIFNFEVNLNLNYSSYTTSAPSHNHTHYNHNQAQPMPHSSYYGEESHFPGTAPFTCTSGCNSGGCNSGQQLHPQPQSHQLYNGGAGGGSFYDWSGNGSGSISNLGSINGGGGSSGCGNGMYQ